MHKKFGISSDKVIFETRVKHPVKNGSFAYFFISDFNNASLAFAFLNLL